MWRLATRPDFRVQVVGAGLACCSLEVEAAVSTGQLIPDESNGAIAASGTIMIVAGTITEALQPALERMYAELGEHGPVQIMSFGACATSGGPYWDAPTVAKGVQSLPVATYVPGCPPRPEALVVELERLVDAMVAR